MTRLLAAIGVVLVLAQSAFALQPPPGQTEFVPVSQLPPGDQLPAAPLLIAAYAFVWVALLAYLWSIRRRRRARECPAVAEIGLTAESGVAKREDVHILAAHLLLPLCRCVACHGPIPRRARSGGRPTRRRQVYGALFGTETPTKVA